MIHNTIQKTFYCGIYYMHIYPTILRMKENLPI